MGNALSRRIYSCYQYPFLERPTLGKEYSRFAKNEYPNMPPLESTYKNTLVNLSGPVNFGLFEAFYRQCNVIFVEI